MKTERRGQELMQQKNQIITLKQSFPLLLYLLSVSVLELLAYLVGDMFAVVASRIWLLSALLCLLLFLAEVLLTVKRDISERNFLCLFGFLLLFSCFAFTIGNIGISDVSPEAALQAAAGLDSFSEADFNYTGTAFLGYSNRQYILNALPALILGRSIFSLHLGFALPFLMGLTLLFFEIRAYLREQKHNEALALLPLYALPVFPFVTEYFMQFEQAITPISFTMLGLALLMRFYRRRTVPGIFALSFVGGMCCNAYTPVLAFFGFLLVFLALWAIEKIYTHRSAVFSKKRLPQIALCLALLVQLFCYFAASLFTEQKRMITTVRQEASFLDVAFSAWIDFFTDKYAVFWGFFLEAVIIYLAAALIGRLKLHDFFIAVWMLLAVFFSCYMTGYTVYEKPHEIQRNLLIVPVFVTAFFFAVLRIVKKAHSRFLKLRTARQEPPFSSSHKARHALVLLVSVTKRLLLPAVLALFLLLGQYNFSREHQSFTYYQWVQPMKFFISHTEELLSERKLADTAEFNLILLTDSILQKNPQDYAAFFYPNAHVYTADTHELPAGVDFSLPTLIFSEQAEIPGQTEVFSKTFQNLRYGTVIIWYYASPAASVGLLGEQ